MIYTRGLSYTQLLWLISCNYITCKFTGQIGMARPFCAGYLLIRDYKHPVGLTYNPGALLKKGFIPKEKGHIARLQENTGEQRNP